jgi:hypothetical protein
MLSFIAASTLTALDLGLLALTAMAIGMKQSNVRLGLLCGAWFLKAGLLGFGFYWIREQAFFSLWWTVSGAIAPFIIFIAWSYFRVQQRTKSAQGL